MKLFFWFKKSGSSPSIKRVSELEDIFVPISALKTEVKFFRYLYFSFKNLILSIRLPFSVQSSFNF